jgi:hypothetical protein
LNGKIAKDEIHPANLHDFTVVSIMNRDWPAYGGPKQIGDKGYQSGTYLTPPKNDASQLAARRKEEYAAAREMIESTFSALAGPGLRRGQVKTMLSLRLKVVLLVPAHNVKFRDLATGSEILRFVHPYSR